MPFVLHVSAFGRQCIVINYHMLAQCPAVGQRCCNIPPWQPTQEEELTQCTFQPNLGRGRAPRSPAKQSGSGGTPAVVGTEPAASRGMSGGPAGKAARPPDVLAQVQVLLRGDSTTEPAAAVDCAATSVVAAVGAQQGAAAHAQASEPAAAGMPGAVQVGAALEGFSTFLGQVTSELRKLQAG